MIVGISLRKINPKCFCDLPGIIMPSFGLAMQGLIGIVAAFLAAGPLTMCIEKTESALLLPVAWFFVNRAIGEIGMDLMQVGNLFLLTAGAVLSLVLKNNKRLMMRVCVPVLVIGAGVLSERVTEKLFVRK